jgi:hypothetical protein
LNERSHQKLSLARNLEHWMGAIHGVLSKFT